MIDEPPVVSVRANWRAGTLATSGVDIGQQSQYRLVACCIATNIEIHVRSRQSRIYMGRQA